MGRGASCGQPSNLLYGAVGRRQRPVDALEVQELGLDDLRARLITTQKLSPAHVHDMALCLQCHAEVDSVIAANRDRILEELARQAGCSLELDLLSPDWGRPGWRDHRVKLSASDWHLLLYSVQIFAGDESPLHNSPDGLTSRDTFDVLSGGREPEELDRSWSCEWDECGFSGPVEEMVYYNGFGMTGFLCRECAAEQISSDGP